MAELFTTKYWPTEWEQGVIKTDNVMGIMTTELSPIGHQFVEFAKTAQKPLLDIGAAYGVATYPALQSGAEIIACDLSEYHLDILKRGVPPAYRSKLKILCASFPDELDFSNNSLAGIHISMVLHFLRGENVIRGLKKCHQWLINGGKLFIVVVTPYHGILDVLPTYEANVKAGKRWPGEIDLLSHVPEKWKNQLPPMGHCFMPDVLQSAVEEAGFIVEKNDFFCYENVPPEYKTNGKEYIGLIARK